MTTLIAVIKALGALTALISGVIVWGNRRANVQRLDDAEAKAKESGDTSDVEAVFGGPPGPPAQ